MSKSTDSLFTNIVYRLDHPGDKIARARKKLYWFSAVSLGIVFLVSISSQFFRSNTFWIDSFTHSLFESYCGIISFVIAYVIFREYRSSGKRSNLFLFLAFVSMGVYDFFHAYSNHCVTLFVWFHSLSASSGALFFLYSAVSVKNNSKDPPWLQRFFVLFGITAILASAAALVKFAPPLPYAVTAEALHHVPVNLPVVWNFTLPTIMVNTLSAVFFLFSGVYFLRYFRDTNDVIYHVFALSAFLFFESELLFTFSRLWDPSWWYWHVIKLIIYIGLIIGFAHGFTRTFRDLRESREKLSGTVDELKRAYDHLKNTQEELLESEKLASIGKMVAAISHEIRNPLGAIKNSVGIFKHHASLSPEDEELLDIIGKEINRLDTTISDFLGFAKPHPLQKTITNLNDLIEETIALLVHNGKTTPMVKIKKLFDTYLPGVSVDRNAMKQVLWNILVNALQAMPDGGALTIKTLCTVRAHQDKPRSELSVIIADTGSGMPPETLSRAFQPFFSTKSKGTGLGLSIVERIIKQHRGRISLTSTTGEGTQVRIDIPSDLEGSLIMKEDEHGVSIDSR